MNEFKGLMKVKPVYSIKRSKMGQFIVYEVLSGMMYNLYSTRNKAEYVALILNGNVKNFFKYKI